MPGAVDVDVESIGVEPAATEGILAFKVGQELLGNGYALLRSPLRDRGLLDIVQISDGEPDGLALQHLLLTLLERHGRHQEWDVVESVVDLAVLGVDQLKEGPRHALPALLLGRLRVHLHDEVDHVIAIIGPVEIVQVAFEFDVKIVDGAYHGIGDVRLEVVGRWALPELSDVFDDEFAVSADADDIASLDFNDRRFLATRRLVDAFFASHGNGPLLPLLNGQPQRQLLQRSQILRVVHFKFNA